MFLVRYLGLSCSLHSVEHCVISVRCMIRCLSQSVFLSLLVVRSFRCAPSSSRGRIPMRPSQPTSPPGPRVDSLHRETERCSRPSRSAPFMPRLSLGYATSARDARRGVASSVAPILHTRCTESYLMENLANHRANLASTHDHRAAAFPSVSSSTSVSSRIKFLFLCPIDIHPFQNPPYRFDHSYFTRLDATR